MDVGYLQQQLCRAPVAGNNLAVREESRRQQKTKQKRLWAPRSPKLSEVPQSNPKTI
jgi:hypothetical protein